MPRFTAPLTWLLLALVLVAGGVALAALTADDPGRVERPSPASPPGATPPGSASPADPAADARYVAPDGDDAAAGTLEDPWASVQHAVDSGAREIVLRAGSYPGFVVERGGDAERPLVIGAAPGEEVVIQAADPSAAIRVAGASHVVLRGMTVTGASEPFGAGIRIEGGASEVLIEAAVIRDNRSFGIEVVDSSAVTVRGSLLEGNDTGIRLIGQEDPSAVGDVLVEGNLIRNNAGMVVNDEEPNNDFGANAIIFHHVSGGVVVRDNRVHGHRAESIDYGTDGGAFEVWGSSNLHISENTLWDNENVMETGSDGPPCEGISFTRNVAYSASSWGLSVGMILRCASDSLVAHNTFDGLDWFTWELSHMAEGSTFGGSIDGLRILNNIAVDSRAYVFLTDLPPGVQLDHNLLHIGPDATAEDADELAHRQGGPTAGDLHELRTMTGREASSLAAAPRFMDRAARDYRLQPGSPAVDAGAQVLDEPYAGAAPDIGRFELDGEG